MMNVGCVLVSTHFNEVWILLGYSLCGINIWLNFEGKIISEYGSRGISHYGYDYKLL